MQMGRILLSLLVILSLPPQIKVGVEGEGRGKVCIHLEILHLQHSHGCQPRQTEYPSSMLHS